MRARLDAEAVKAAVSIEQVIGARVALKKAGAGELQGLCPFHQEKTPSFTVTPGRGVYHCFGCGAGGDVFKFIQEQDGLQFGEAVERVATIAGITADTIANRPVVSAAAKAKAPEPVKVQQKITATFEYVDESGELLYEVCRMEPGKNGRKKDFLQRRKHPIDGAWVWGLSAGEYRKGRNGQWYPVKGPSEDGDDELPECRRVLYRLPEVLAASEVYIVEGEKDATTLETWGLVSTTPSGGSAKAWDQSYTDALAGKTVVIIPDNDKPGLTKAAAIEAALKDAARSVLTVCVPTGKDVTEYAEAGHDEHQFAALIHGTRSALHQRNLETRGLLSPAEILELTEGGVNVFLDPSKRAPGLKTGFTRFDDMTVGLRPGELIILAGRPAMGKTALAMNIAENVAARNKPVPVFSLEMSREQLLTRMVCSRARLDQTKYKAGFLSREERLMAQRALNELCSMPLGIDDAALADLDTLHAKLERFKQRHGDIGAVVIDYLQLMTPAKGKGRENRTQDVSALSRGLKLLAKEMKAPIIALSQLSRAPDSRPGDHRPQLADLRDSGSIEQDADMVAFVFREEYYKPNEPSLRGLAELILAKQRNGPVGTVKFTFLNHCTRFENLYEARD